MAVKAVERESGCFAKAAEDEVLFVLRAKDPIAPRIVREWAKMAVGLHEKEKIEEALEVAREMEKWTATQRSVDEESGDGRVRRKTEKLKGNRELESEQVQALAVRFADSVQKYTLYVHQLSRSKGFWDQGLNLGEKIALMHSELSEALEGIRKGNPRDEHCPDFSSLEIELADAVIRILDLAGGVGLRVGEAVVAKVAYNESRAYKHGKKF